jgi:hypothetical protein
VQPQPERPSRSRPILTPLFDVSSVRRRSSWTTGDTGATGELDLECPAWSTADSAGELARRRQAHPVVDRVRYPGRPADPHLPGDRSER